MGDGPCESHRLPVGGLIDENGSQELAEGERPLDADAVANRACRAS